MQFITCASVYASDPAGSPQITRALLRRRDKSSYSRELRGRATPRTARRHCSNIGTIISVICQCTKSGDTDTTTRISTCQRMRTSTLENGEAN
jgi:hypothetical protein